MTPKIFAALLCLIVIAVAAPSEDLVRADIANYTQHKWYSGTSALTQAISTSPTAHSITCSSTPNATPTTTPLCFGSTEGPGAPA